MPASAIQEQSLEPTPPELTGDAVPTLAGLYGQYVRYTWRCLRSLGVPESELDDAIQDVFLVVQKRLPAFDGRVSPKTWLYAIAIRVARRYKERSRRAMRRHESHDEHAQDLASASNTEIEFDQSQRLVNARRALRALSDDKREVFVLGQVEQMSAPEIAE